MNTLTFGRTKMTQHLFEQRLIFSFKHHKKFFQIEKNHRLSSIKERLFANEKKILS